ncbi:hypothetical protein CPAR01_04931 [Colletotrichum paranaense]|uniref:Uncharacterized protein n=3 Tax=Colletotrichum acutatum species complex TaxID=2707335 RepID=A0AAI9YFT9_9PEZI|nr:uncharacterized protein CCOS01_16334 [Colletotrichum costaricense]XP_060353417.1 uncharacterized protein CPAR01_04931 [Colletotrichum paranaense]KAI3539541.1 hypothetical protein CSPX01_08757 [Colletotrichum filicis]KAK1447714.1 hypothetical protein CMEL01_09553 [Colletotrichum melonis]KAK1507075.1 hypothetical protein CCOS01_16334 [Colletotrichum costaricense]KAK1544298.1 hypothetical protein CPAR01_04931 [Colletotrichum paranaense]
MLRSVSKAPQCLPPVLFGRTSHVPFLWQLWFSFTPSLLARCLSGIIWLWRSLSGLSSLAVFCFYSLIFAHPLQVSIPGSIAFRTMASIS